MVRQASITMILCIWLLLSGCTAGGLFGMAASSVLSSNKPAVEVTATGEAKNQLLRNTSETKNTDNREIEMGNNAKLTDDRDTTIYNKQMSTPVLVLLILGWFLPSPKECGRLILSGIKAIVKAMKGGL